MRITSAFGRGVACEDRGGTRVGSRGGQRSRDRSPDPDRDRIIEISGSSTAVTMAKSLITIAMDLGDGAPGGRREGGDRRGGGGRFSR